MHCGKPVQKISLVDADRVNKLNAIAPQALVQKIRSASQLSQEHYPGLLSEKRNITALMLDVAGSHAITEQLGLETWVEVMNQAYDRIAPLVNRYEGTISLVVDDALLAFFGAPVAHEDDPLRAVQAGLEIITQIKQYSQEVKQGHGVDFAMWVSINTGSIVLGPAHGDLTADYTGFGKVVSLASSIKSVGTPMNVLVADNTYQFIAPNFDCLDLGSVDVSGWNEPVHVFQVQSARATPGTRRGFTNLASPMVGRDGEVAILLRACEAVRAGMGRAVVIVGEPGIGKTRLIQEWQKASEALMISGRPSSENPTTGLWVSGHCISYGQGLAYQLVIDVLKNLIGVTETSDESETHQALLALLKKLFDSQVMEVYPFLGHLLSLKLEGEALLRAQINDPLAIKTQYLLAVQRLFQALMKEKPLILVLEDLHWADPSSVDLFVNLLPLVQNEPILLCLTTRPDHESQGWRLISSAHQSLDNSLTDISLHSLPEKESKTLVANLLEIESLPTRVRDEILYKAEGNPYFVEELIRMFIDQGVIVQQGSDWIAREGISEHDIPDNVQGLLLAHIDRLPGDARHTLLIASVIGRTFPVKVLSHIMNDTQTLKSDISILESSGLIELVKIEPDLEYAFHHTLVQDAANALLLMKDKKRLHQAVGEAIEILYADRKKEFSAVLAYHFKEAEQERRALEYFFVAGEEALATFANQEAEIQYRRALELKCLSEPDLARLYSRLGEALLNQDRLEEAQQVFLKGIDIYKNCGDSDGIALLYAWLARLIFRTGNQPEYLRVCQEGLELVKDVLDSIGVGTLINEASKAYYFNGMPVIAKSLCLRAVSLAEQLDAIELQANALVTLGIQEDVPLAESYEALYKAIDLSESHGFLALAQGAHNTLAVLVTDWQADLQTGLEHYFRAAELSKLRGIASAELFALISYVDILISLGRLDEADKEIPRLDELVMKVPNSATVFLNAKSIKSQLISKKGDWETAINIQRECLSVFNDYKYLELIVTYTCTLTSMVLESHRWGGPVDLHKVEALLLETVPIADQVYAWGQKWVYPRMSMIKARQGRLDEARNWLGKFQEAANNMPSGWDVRQQELCNVEIASAELDWTKALSAIEKVVLEQQRIGLRVDWAASLLYWANILLRRGDPADLERAQSLLVEAISAFNEMGVGRYPEIGQMLLRETHTRLHAQTLDHAEMTRELKKARKVQESLLPEKLPEIPGWQLEVALKPAHETSGDFYDCLAFPDGKLGLVIADVTDKGTSAALYMALSRSLWRAFAVNHPDKPELTLQETNRRISADTHGGLFITLFYGILNPLNGVFTYCSAGHHPALLLRIQNGSIEDLEQTGIPLGVFEDAHWSQRSFKIKPGDALVLYTDGITDAQNAAEEFFGLERLREVMKRQYGKSAKELHEVLLGEVRNWMGDAPQYDDITLMVIVREKAAY